MRVLIVDDCAAARDGLQSILRSLDGLEVVGEAIDGFDAIEQVMLLQPDMVLMDAQMPGMDGIQATRCLKQQFPSIKVLVLAVHAQYVDAAQSAGADSCLLKDVARQELLQAVQECAGGLPGQNPV